MANENLPQRQCLQAMRTRIIPWLSNPEDMSVLLAKPPLRQPQGVKVIAERPPLPATIRKNSSPRYYQQWRKEEMEAIRYILMGCVLEGEADYTLGGCQTPSAGDLFEMETHNIQVLTLPEQTLFIVPPGIPHADGRRFHWERPFPEKAHSRIFWLLIAPNSFLCHVCNTRGIHHDSTAVVIIEDHALHPMANILIEELEEREVGFESVARNLLLAMMRRVERGLLIGRMLPSLIGWRGLHPTYYDLPNPSRPVRESNTRIAGVCDYIQKHIADPLTLPQIAAWACVSPQYLNRLFRASHGMSAMKYVVQCRIQTAKHLLATTEAADLSISELSAKVGFADASYFTRVFTEQLKISPTEFRKRHYIRKD